MANRVEHVKIAHVVAIAKNRVIGVDGGLAWRISDDLKWFKTVTMGKPVVMGRKTYASIGKPLPGRDNIVVTRGVGFSANGVFVVRAVKDALALARECAERRSVAELCVIGGGEIYRQTFDAADRIYLTRVDADVDGDAFFPEIDSGQWSANRVGGCEKGARNDYACEFFILDRRRR